MDRFKLQTRDTVDMPIDKTVFERATRRREPWVQDNARGGHSYYGVCPACDNPVQLVNLYSDQDQSARPHGRHHAYTVQGLAVYDQRAYDDCPLAAPKTFDSSQRRPTGDPRSLAILRQLIDQFDRVIYLVRQFSGIAVSEALATSMLEEYIRADGHQYRHAHMLNIPWMFAYMGGGRPRTLYGRFVHDNDALQGAVASNVAAAVWHESRLNAAERHGRTPYLNVSFFYLDHRSRRRDEAIEECMTLGVLDASQGRDGIIVYEQVIPIETARWSALISTPRNEQAKAQAERWIPIARAVLDPQNIIE